MVTSKQLNNRFKERVAPAMKVASHKGKPYSNKPKKDIYRTNKIFVKRYWVGFKGIKNSDELVNADTPKEAINKYMWDRGIKNNNQEEIIVKRWKR